METTTQIPAEQIASAIESSANKDLFLSFIVGAAVVIWVIKLLYPMVMGKKKGDDNETYKKASEIVTQKDAYGQYILLNIPRMLQDFTNSLEGFTSEIRQLVNHQQETNTRNMEIIESMHDAVQETLRIVQKSNKR